jgi:hypothetical protein
MAERDERLERIEHDVRHVGWHLVSVLEEGQLPPFLYTIGLERTQRHPELVIFGLEYPVMEEAMQTLAYRVTQGERFEGGRAYDGIFEELPCSFLEVHESRFREHFGLANDWYGQHGAKPRRFRVLQVVWPDEEGVFPWAAGFDPDFRGMQPNLHVAGEEELLDWDADVDTDHIQVIGPERELVKITFFLARDEDGYPPYERENLWAWPLPEGSYRIESIPYYVRGISKGDVIDVATQGARRFAKRLVEASGNSTIRIWTDDIDTSEYVMEQLRLRGCEVDNEHEPKLVAVSVPGDVEYSEILRWIAEGAADDRWDFEEACIAHEDQ